MHFCDQNFCSLEASIELLISSFTFALFLGFGLGIRHNMSIYIYIYLYLLPFCCSSCSILGLTASFLSMLT